MIEGYASRSIIPGHHQITIRQIMLLVAVVAVAMGVFIHRRNKILSDHYRYRAENAASHREEYREWAREARFDAERLSRKVEEIPEHMQYLRERMEKGASNHRRFAEHFDRIADYNNQMEQIFRRAARRPLSPRPALRPRPKL